MLRGDAKGAVRCLTKREKGGRMLPDDVEEMTGETVADVLESKHPNARASSQSVTKSPTLSMSVDVDMKLLLDDSLAPLDGEEPTVMLWSIGC
jgi:hypothetical protein